MLFRKKYINNYNPIFSIPINNKPRPSFIKYAMERASKIDVARTELNYVIQPKNIKTGLIIKRYRRLNEHRACAMRAMVQAMLYHFNIISRLVYASVEQLADECGLSTISKAGNKSISRASRLITEFMEPMGFIKCKTSWDKSSRTYMPKVIKLTSLFFMLFGISHTKLKNARLQQLGWVNKNLLIKGLKKISLKEAKLKNKNDRIKKLFEYREKKKKISKRKTLAKNLFTLSPCLSRQKILNILIKKYSISELKKMGSEGLKKLVNIEYFYLKKLASSALVDPP
ncbi:plasmid replication initiator RepA [Buchnera aphidicola]|uniref:plasmid replication initiator RepA n=1 Tax=Buchnera aphidicola TaxID=9 RepID=UPI003464E652